MHALLGAYMNDGMHETVMLDIALELQKAMPRVMKDHFFKHSWAYKYESGGEDDEMAGTVSKF